MSLAQKELRLILHTQVWPVAQAIQMQYVPGSSEGLPTFIQNVKEIYYAQTRTANTACGVHKRNPYR